MKHKEPMRSGILGHCYWIGICAVLVAGCSPAYMSDIYTTSTPRTQSFNLRGIDPTPVAILGVVSPPGLQGFAPFLSHALVSAISEAQPSIRVIPTSEIVSIINEQDRGLTSDYTQLLSGFIASGVLDRKRMSAIGAKLNSHYFLLPGAAEFDQAVTDRYDVAGLKLVRNRITTLRLWLQVWDANSGRLLCESTGEITAVTALLTVKRTVPLEELARRLWLRMIKENLLEAKSTRRLSRSSAVSGQ